jgi:hypothetical protein
MSDPFDEVACVARLVRAGFAEDFARRQCAAIAAAVALPPEVRAVPESLRGTSTGTRSDQKYPNNKAPDLQKLVERFGGYDRITPEAWAEHDAAMAQWHIDRRLHTAGNYFEGRKPEAKSKPKPTRRRLA